MATTRPRPFVASDPSVGITLSDLTEAVAEWHALELPADTPIRCTGMIEIDLVNGPRVARLTAMPAEVKS